jgi:outer membrane protein
MKNFLIILTALTASLTASAQFKVGYVDVHLAVDKSTVGKKAKEEMKKEGEKRQKDLSKKEADLGKMKEDIEKKRSVLSEEAFQKRAQEWQLEFQKFNESVAKARAELQKKESELLEPIVKKIKTAVDKIAKEKGFAMVIRSNQNDQIVLYSASEFDLTEDVVKALDKEK